MNTLSDLAANQQNQGSYNGVVSVNGKPVEVRNGSAQFNGNTYHVANDMRTVIDNNGNPVGVINNGVFSQLQGTVNQQ